MTSGNDADVIVIGGGISGLATAWGLQRRGVRVMLLEAAARAGGCIGTLRENGYLYESGPNSALETTPLIAPLLRELGVDSSRIPANPHARNRYVLRGGKLIAVPLSPMSLLTTSLFSFRAKLRLFCEPFIGAGKPDVEESVADFVRRRLGSEFLDFAINPFVGGVYAGDPEALSLGAAFPRLHELERQYGSLIHGQLLGARGRTRNPEKSRQSAAMFAFQDGMQTLTDVIAHRLARIELGAEARSVMVGSNGCAVTALRAGASLEFRARAVVLAVPAYAAAKLVAPWAPQAAAALDAIPYPPVAVVHSAYRRTAIAHRLDGFGMLVPQCERRQILGSIFSSTLFADRAPEGQVLLTTFVGGTRQPEMALLDEDEIVRRVQAEHSALIGARERPEPVRVTRWPRAIPQYVLGHAKRIANIEAAERDFHGLFFCANYRGGIAIGDCIKSSNRAAEEVAAYLRAA